VFHFTNRGRACCVFAQFNVFIRSDTEWKQSLSNAAGVITTLYPADRPARSRRWLDVSLITRIDGRVWLLTSMLSNPLTVSVELH
jgi:hypothetical protein